MTNASGVTTGGLRLAGECGERGPLTRADPPRRPPSKARSMRVRMCSQSPAAGRSRGPAAGPRVGVSRASPRAAFLASRAGATPSCARPRHGASFPKAPALSRGARERRTRSRNHGPEREHENVPGRNARRLARARGSRRCPRSRGSPGESFVPRAASASRRRARRSHLAGSSLVAPSRLCRTGSPREARARAWRRASGAARAARGLGGGRRPVPSRAPQPRADVRAVVARAHAACLRGGVCGLRQRPRRRRETRADTRLATASHDAAGAGAARFALRNDPVCDRLLPESSLWGSNWWSQNARRFPLLKVWCDERGCPRGLRATLRPADAARERPARARRQRVGFSPRCSRSRCRSARR